MARKRFGSIEGVTAPRLPDLDSPDTAFSGGVGLDSYRPETSPIAQAATIRAAAPAPQPSGIADLLRGSPVASSPQMAQPMAQAAPQPMAQPQTPVQQPTPQPTPTPTPTPTPDPLPGTGGPYDPTRLNYEGSTYTGPPVQGTKSAILQPTDAQVQQIQSFLNETGIKLPKDWRTRLYQDPAGFIAELRGLDPRKTPGNNFPRAGDFIESILRGTQQTTDPNAASMFYDQAAYNQGLTRLRQSGLEGAREDEEQVLQILASRGLLDSGIAAKELTRLRADRAQNYRMAAARLNEILFSNASDHAKREALTRLQSELQLSNQQSLLRLRYQLEQDLEESRHENDFMGFLGGVAGLGVGAATGNPALGLYGLSQMSGRAPQQQILTSDYDSVG